MHFKRFILTSTKDSKKIELIAKRISIEAILFTLTSFVHNILRKFYTPFWLRECILFPLLQKTNYKIALKKAILYRKHGEKARLQVFKEPILAVIFRAKLVFYHF